MTGFIVCVYCTKTNRYLCLVDLEETFLTEFFDIEDIPEKFKICRYKYLLKKDPTTDAIQVYERDLRQRHLKFLHGDLDLEDVLFSDLTREEATVDKMLTLFSTKFHCKLQDFTIQKQSRFDNFYKSYSLYYYQVEEEIPVKKNAVWMSVSSMNNFITFLPKSRSLHWTLVKTIQFLNKVNE
jgi:hypothetical protein